PGLPGKLAPRAVKAAFDAGDRDLRRGRVALGVVPDEQLLVLLQRQPGAGAGARRHELGVGDGGALPVAAPAPVMERAGDVGALDFALAEVAAHMRAIAVQNRELAALTLEDDQLGPEGLDLVWLAVLELV